MKTKCMSCGGSMKKMAIGGTTTKRIIKKSTGGIYGIPQENMGTSDQYGFGQKGGTVKKPLKKTRIIDSKIPMKGPGAPVYKPLLAKKGGTHKMPNGKVMLNSKMQKGGGTRSMAPIAPTVRPMKNDPKKCIGSPPGYVWNERLGGCVAPAKSMMKKGGATKATKFAALAPPYNKATFADRIAGAKKKK